MNRISPPTRVVLTRAILGLAWIACGAWGGFATRAVADCPLPVAYQNSVTVIEGDWKITLATDRDRYTLGQPVSMYLSYENTGASVLEIPNPNSITPLESFYLMSASCISVTDPDCFLVFYYPHLIQYYGVAIPVNPGQCATSTQSWNGVSQGGRAVTPGDYRLLAGMSRAFGNIFLPPGGIQLPLRIDEEVPTERTTWGRIKVVYR